MYIIHLGIRSIVAQKQNAHYVLQAEFRYVCKTYIILYLVYNSDVGSLYELFCNWFASMTL